MKPADKSPEMTDVLNRMAFSVFGRDRTKTIQENACVTCGGHATMFKDDLSRKEYSISGMCQVCQDETFGGDDE